MMTAKRVATIREQLQSFVEEFAAELGRSERRHWCGKYLEGLLREGERKSIEPMAARVGGDDQALQQFVNQSPWDHELVLDRLSQQMRRHADQPGVLVLDDTSLPKQGRHSVGVARQYCGALGKIANCQSIVTWHWAAPGRHWPLAAQLYLPAVWTDDPARMTKAGVPPAAQCFREKWRIGLDLLEAMKPQLPAYQAIVFDAGDGGVLPLLAELEKRGEPYLAQVPSNVAAWPAEATASVVRAAVGRSRRPPVVRDPAVHPRPMPEWRDRLLQTPDRWTTIRLPRADGAVQAVAVRVQASQRGNRWRQPGVAPLAVDRASRGPLVQLLPVQPASRHFPGGIDSVGPPALDRRARGSTTERGTRSRSLRGPLLARPASPSHPLLPCLLLPDPAARVKKNAPRWLKSAARSSRR